MTFKNNIKLLESYKSRSNKNNDKIDTVISFYRDKQIYMKTAENAIVMLASKNKATIPKALNNFQDLVDKYIFAGPISRAGFLEVKTTDFSNPKSHIQLNIKTRNSDRFDNVKEGAEKLAFDEIFKKVKARLTDEITDMLNLKKSMKIKIGVNFEVGKHIDIDPFQDEVDVKDGPLKKKDQRKSYVKDLKTLVWSTKYKPCTKSNIDELIDEQYTELNKKMKN